MKNFVQLDNLIVTGTLQATQAPDVVPEGRTFVEIPEGAPMPDFGAVYTPATKTFVAPKV